MNNSDFLLLTTLHSEMDANILKGVLENHGIQVKVNATRTAPSKYANLNDTFGIYVIKNRLIDAQEILQEFVPVVKGHAKSSSLMKIFAYIMVTAFCAACAYWIYEMFKYISTGFPF